MQARIYSHSQGSVNEYWTFEVQLHDEEVPFKLQSYDGHLDEAHARYLLEIFETGLSVLDVMDALEEHYGDSETEGYECGDGDNDLSL